VDGTTNKMGGRQRRNERFEGIRGNVGTGQGCVDCGGEHYQPELPVDLEVE
jgi:hypothetical protein